MFGSQSKSAVRNAVHNNFAGLFSEIVKIGCIYVYSPSYLCLLSSSSPSVSPSLSSSSPNFVDSSFLIITLLFGSSFSSHSVGCFTFSVDFVSITDI